MVFTDPQACTIDELRADVAARTEHAAALSQSLDATSDELADVKGQLAIAQQEGAELRVKVLGLVVLSPGAPCFRFLL